jgi:ribosomal-protein-serine acetyltransferase
VPHSVSTWLDQPPPSKIDSGVIRLTRPALADADALVTAINSCLDHLRPWMPWAQHPADRKSIITFLNEAEESWNDRGQFLYLVRLEGEPEVVGGCGLHARRGRGVLEIGYWIHVEHVGNGYATRLARALTDTAFALPGVEVVEIHHDKANGRSKRVPEKLGFSFVGEKPDVADAPGEVGLDWTWRAFRDRWPSGTAPRVEG